MKKLFTAILTTIALTPALASAATLPQPSFVLPGVEGQRIMYGVEFMWGYYCPLQWVNPGAEHTVEMIAPNGESYTYDFYSRIQENAPGEEQGGEASQDPYPNGILIDDFRRPDTKAYWDMQGTYTFIIPADLVYVTVEGEKIPNEQAVLKYYCPGAAKYFDEELVRIIEPSSDTVDRLGNVVVQFPTTYDLEGWQAQLLCDTEKVPVQLTVNGNPEGDVYGTISTDRYHPNRVTIDMSAYTTPGTYELTFAEGIVYQADGKINAAVTFTLYVGVEDPASVNFEFTGEENAWQYVTLFDTFGMEYYPDGSYMNYPVNVESDDAYVTIQVPVEYPLTVTAAEGLMEGVDYLIDSYTDTDYDENEVNCAQINFYTENVYGTTFTVQVGDVESQVKVIAVDNGEAVYYNLHGQRVLNPGKGIYILNGKKIIL